MVSSRDASEHAFQKVQEKGTVVLFSATAPFLLIFFKLLVLHFFLGDFNKRTNLHRSATA